MRGNARYELKRKIAPIGCAYEKSGFEPKSTNNRIQRAFAGPV